MYFITNKKDLNLWSKDLLEISKIFKDNANTFVFEEEYYNLKPISKEYLEFLNKNPIAPNDLKIGDIFETFTLNSLNSKNKIYKVLEIKHNEQDNYDIHVCEVLETREVINYGLFWSKYVNLLRGGLVLWKKWKDRF